MGRNHGLVSMILLFACLLTGCNGNGVETASETQSAWAAGTTVTQSEEGSTATETETSPSEDTATKTSLSAVHSDSNRESALANPSVQESGNNLYLLAENTLLQYPLDLDVSGKADETILYKAADGNSIISFSSDGSNVYFILEKENGSTSVMRIRSGEDAVDLKDFDDESFGEIQAYDDVVYLFGSGWGTPILSVKATETGDGTEGFQDGLCSNAFRWE